MLFVLRTATRMLRATALTAMVAALAGAQAVAPAATLTGTVRIIWGDPQAGAPVHVVILDGPGGPYELRLSDLQIMGAGGLMELQGAQIMVTGTAMAGPAGRGGRLVEVQSLQAIETAPRPFLHPGIGNPPGLANLAIRPNPRSVPYVTILCSFPDSSRVVTATEVNKPSFAAAAPSGDHYWRETSEGGINFAGSFTVGPFTLPNPRSWYVGSTANLDLLMQDCTTLADATVDFSQVSGVALQFNTVLDCCAWGGGGRLVKDGPTRYAPTVWMPTWTLTTGGTWAHELGHALGLPHSSGPYGLVYDSRWDVMSASSWKLDAASGLNFGNQTVGYHKLRLGIAPGWRRIASGGPPERVHVQRSANPATTAGPQVVVIPIAGTPRIFYTLEARRPRVGSFYDDSTSLGLDGILINRVDETLGEPARVVDSDGNGNPNDAGAIWTLGETFRDLARAIRVTVDSASTSGFWVTVENGRLEAVNAGEPRYGGDSVAFGAASARVDTSLVRSTGSIGALIAWQAWTAAPWVQLQVSAGQGTGFVTWAYSASGLGPGQYRDSIVVQSVTNGAARATIPVVLKIASAAGPTLSVSRIAVNDSAAVGQWANYRTVTVNVPAGVAWSASRPAAATRIAFCIENCSTGTATVSGTGPGTFAWYNNGFTGTVGSVFADTITVAAAGLAGSPAYVVQRLTVIGAVTVAMTARTRRDSMPVGAAPVVDSSLVTIGGGGSPTATPWTLFSQSWLAGRVLSVIDSRVVGSGWAHWTRGPRNNAPGRYIDTVFITVPLSPTAFIVDTLDVYAPAVPMIVFAPASRTTTALLGSSIAADSTLVSVLGSGGANWTATSSSTRIFLIGGALPNGVSVNRTGAGSLGYVRRTAGLAAGTYVDTISVASSGVSTRVFVDTLLVTTALPSGPVVVAVGTGAAAMTSLLPTDSLVVPVRLELGASNGARVGGLTARVAWDTVRFAFRRATAGTLGSGALLTDSTGRGNVRFSYADATGTVADITFWTLTLLPKAGANGFGNLGVTVQALANASGTSLFSQAVARPFAACIGLAGGRWGDATNDNIVNIIDAQQIARHSVALAVSNAAAVAANGDVTADGAINIIDAQQIARFSVGLGAAARTNTPRPGGGCP